MFLSTFDKQLALWGLELNSVQKDMLGCYVEAMASYERANVVGTRDVERLWWDHLLDSLSCSLCRSVAKSETLIDVGSGAGLPGIPLQIFFNFRRLCLLESTTKKVEFMEQVLGELELSDSEVVDARAEEAGRSKLYRESFEAATARAVAPLSVISEYCLPFVETGGVFVAMKGMMADEELARGEAAIKELGGEIEEILRVPFISGVEQKDRRLVVVRKVQETPEVYPRKIGTPKKEPLGGNG